ncbi:hypothetical protein CH252_31205 [Rhodococcus sp. 06-1477-1B]|nr:hypothetical protein CH252_31205 [Rhodococcus sp. 06-1477-1B]
MLVGSTSVVVSVIRPPSIASAVARAASLGLDGQVEGSRAPVVRPVSRLARFTWNRLGSPALRD